MGADKLFSIFVAAVCVVMLIRMALGDQRRARFDRVFTKLWSGMERQAVFIWNWRRRRQSRAKAKQVAQDVIQRVRHRVDKEGNVLTPDAFKEPRKPH